MAVTVNADGTVAVNGIQSIFPRDSINHAVSMVAGFDGDAIKLGQMTDDGRLKVDASLSVAGITIGAVQIQGATFGGSFFTLGEVLNPDATTYALYVQDQRQTFTGSSLNVHVGNASIPVTQSGTWTVGLTAEAIMIGTVELSDGTNTAGVTAAKALLVDGSATTQPVSGTVTAIIGAPLGTDILIFDEQLAVASSATVHVVQYTVPVGKTFYLKRVEASGDSPAIYVMNGASAVMGKKRSSYSGFNVDFTYDTGVDAGLAFAAGDVIELDVTNDGRGAAGFNGTIYGRLV